MSARVPTLAVDFDGVLHDPTNVTPGHRMGLPCKGALEAMGALRRRGYRLIIFTTNRIEPVTNWLTYFGVPFDQVTNTKPEAEVYIDDRGLRHTSWTETMIELDRLERGLCP